MVETRALLTARPRPPYPSEDSDVDAIAAEVLEALRSPSILRAPERRRTIARCDLSVDLIER